MKIVEVPTSLGPARLSFFTPARHAVRIVLGHGAGGGIGARDLQAAASALPADGIEVVLVEQPWVVAGKKVAPNPARLDEGWIEVFDALAEGPPTIVGGRSAGARVAARTADSVAAVGCALLAFPLHAPGKPEKSRADELLAVDVPTLVVQGTADSFGTAKEVSAEVGRRRRFTVVPVLDADHGFKVPARSKSSTDAGLETVTSALRAFAHTFV